MLDPGHGGNSSGAMGANPNYPEKRINLDLSLKIKAILESLGAKVIMTRSNDAYLTLDERVELCEKYKPNIFISVHHNWAAAVSAKGTSTFYFEPFSMDMCNSIYKQLSSVYKNSIYPNDSGSSYLRGCNYYPFAVTRHWYCPSVLLEYGFMSNSKEFQIIIDPSVQDSFAKATVRGIIDYIKNYGTIGKNTVDTTPTPKPNPDDDTSSNMAGVETDEGYYDEDGNFIYWDLPSKPETSPENESENTSSETSSQTESQPENNGQTVGGSGS